MTARLDWNRLAVCLVLACGGVLSARAEEPSGGSAKPGAQQAAEGWFCVPPATQAFSHCAKGSAQSEESVARCRREEAARPRKPARFRVGRGPWTEFSSSGYRCVPVPVGTRYRVSVENFASWQEVLSEDCASRVKDLVEPNFYGSLTTRCSHRKTDADERLAADSSAGRPPPNAK